MKTHFIHLTSILIVLLLVGCRNANDATTENAENYLNAAIEGQRDEAEKNVCSDNQEELLALIQDEAETQDLKCEGDDKQVECTVTSVLDEKETRFAFTFAMQSDKVCEIVAITRQH